jgi:hypothetical protein
MQGTQKLRPLYGFEQTRVPMPLLLAVALIAACLAYVSLLAQPALVRGLSAVWGSAASSARNTDWVIPVVAGSVALAGATLCVVALSAFIRGVQRAPYVWLSPVLVGFSCVVLARMRIDLPLAYVPVGAFAGLAGMLMLGGGALLQVRGVASKLCGVLLLGLPLLTLIAGYSHLAGGLGAAWSALDSSAALFSFVLALTCGGVGLVAFVARPLQANMGAEASRRARQLQEHRTLLEQAIERARVSELQKVDAERRAQVAEYSLQVQGARLSASAPGFARHADDTAEFVAHARPRLGRGVVLALYALLIPAAAAVAYFGAYRPLARRAALQQVAGSNAGTQQAAELAALRKEFSAERAKLEAALAAERAKLTEALAAAEHAPPAGAAAKREAAAPAAQPDASEAPQAAAPRTPAKRVARATTHRHAPRAPSRKAAPTDASATRPPAAAGADSAKDAAGALKEHVNNDPIGGLDGL